MSFQAINNDHKRPQILIVSKKYPKSNESSPNKKEFANSDILWNKSNRYSGISWKKKEEKETPIYRWSCLIELRLETWVYFLTNSTNFNTKEGDKLISRKRTAYSVTILTSSNSPAQVPSFWCALIKRLQSLPFLSFNSSRWFKKDPSESHNNKISP